GARHCTDRTLQRAALRRAAAIATVPVQRRRLRDRPSGRLDARDRCVPAGAVLTPCHALARLAARLCPPGPWRGGARGRCFDREAGSGGALNTGARGTRGTERNQPGSAAGVSSTAPSRPVVSTSV